jgi:acetyl esterase/lipase
LEWHTATLTSHPALRKQKILLAGTPLSCHSTIANEILLTVAYQFHYHSPVRKLFLILVLTASASAQQVTIPLWHDGAPLPTVTDTPEKDITLSTDRFVAGKPLSHLTNVSNPTLAFYPTPVANNTGAAVVVFPGGGYRILAYDLEGTEVCTWLNSIGVNCILVKYRVPFRDHYPENPADIVDGQQAMRVTRARAAEWHLDPKRIGILGFSAGGHLAAVLSNHANDRLVEEPSNSPIHTIRNYVDARPDFTILIYPAYLTNEPAMTALTHGIDPTANTPPTFLLQAEDDPVHVENVTIYFNALKALKVPAELHTYAQGGHGYGLRPTELPVTHWPALVETWLHTIHVLDAPSR